MCIIDEAGQCDIASSLIPISKADKLLLVGDINQLQPIISVDYNINARLMAKYEIDPLYNYCTNSIISLMMNVDNVSPNILLSHHYRCAKDIVNFSNQRYYASKLNIKTNEHNDAMQFIKVENYLHEYEKNTSSAEANAILEYITSNGIDANNVVIITPFRNQANLIQAKLKENKLESIKCGTIHTIQGGECDNIIFSPAIGLKTSPKTYNWLANNKELINVGITRVKKKFIMIADDKALELKAHKEYEDDIIALKNYVINKGNSTVFKSFVNNKVIGLSNDSVYENKLFETISHFCSVNKKFKIRRNVKVSDILTSIDEKELKSYFYKAEFDEVIYYKNIFGKYVPSIVLEINGGEHYFISSKYGTNDSKKMKICEKHKLKYLAIPNSYAKSYETLSMLLKRMIGEKDEGFTLFDLN